MAEDLEAGVLRALADPDPTIRRMAAVRAHKVLPRSVALVEALEALLAHDDKYLRRAAAASYVALHELGTRAPALARLRDDPADLVVLTARGSLLDPAHEIAELTFVVRAIGQATRGSATAFSRTAARWHQFLWLYSPNPRAATVMKTVTSEALDRDADLLHDALVALLRDRPAPSPITQLQIDADLDADRLALHGFVDGAPAWTAETCSPLAAFRQLDSAVWDTHDAPWPAMFTAGCFALAAGRAAERSPSGFAGGAAERELATCVGGSGERVFVGFVRPTGLSYSENDH